VFKFEVAYTTPFVWRETRVVYAKNEMKAAALVKCEVQKQLYDELGRNVYVDVLSVRQIASPD
jgi:hypothetical protein